MFREPGTRRLGGAYAVARPRKGTVRRRARDHNNRMELMAAIQGIENVTRPARLRLVTDSVYVKDGITKWIHGWKRNGWKTAAKKPVKNEDLWRRLDAALAGHDVDWQWVKGHAGHPENERADELARLGIAKL